MKSLRFAACAALCAAGVALTPFVAEAATARSEVNLITPQGVGNYVGTITFSDTSAGLLMSTDLYGLLEGQRNVMLNNSTTCFPAMTGDRTGVILSSAAAELPILRVASNGTSKDSIIVENLTVNDIMGRTVIINSAGNNVSVMPGSSMACGTIE